MAGASDASGFGAAAEVDADTAAGAAATGGGEVAAGGVTEAVAAAAAWGLELVAGDSEDEVTGGSAPGPGAADGSLIADAPPPSAIAAVAESNMTKAVAKTAAGFRPLLCDPPSLLMLHNPFFVA